MKGLVMGAACLAAMGSAHAGWGHDDHERFATMITTTTNGHDGHDDHERFATMIATLTMVRQKRNSRKITFIVSVADRFRGLMAFVATLSSRT